MKDNTRPYMKDNTRPYMNDNTRPYMNDNTPVGSRSLLRQPRRKNFLVFGCSGVGEGDAGVDGCVLVERLKSAIVPLVLIALDQDSLPLPALCQSSPRREKDEDAAG